MKLKYELQVNMKDGHILAIISMVLFLILYILSLFNTQYSEAMRYVSYGMPAFLLFVSLGLYQIGNFSIQLTETEFLYRSLLKRRRIPYYKIKKVSLKTQNSIKGLIFKMTLENGLDFRFNRCNVSDKDIQKLMTLLKESCNIKEA